ncbi:MAG: aminodeoxychorismate/anthranilate synthase component II [Gammaproteobacteria bacterium]|jgi:anthranilate synthase component 2|nr:aminodeoxychorismate/anthranilate synthase component II [Gammaproteobacteria bacterium]MCP4880230.1 aminodeoxychorismate/anthranilate synthase component II [Gammaproteobacteria bacterium]MDP6165670.1 aminodeoxychorismate/anthranilate synthase component II [Gammaproteobacteria bacterium]
MKVMIIDNYDSFTYNLYQYIGEIMEEAQRSGRVKDFEVVVKRNDQVSLLDVAVAAPDRIIISPGPGSPDDPEYFGVCADVITQLGPKIPLLGVCLGMQGIVHCFGGKVGLAKLPMHGKVSPIKHDGDGLFRDIPDNLEVMRYHSLVAEAASIPACLQVTASIAEVTSGEEAEVMAVQHREYPISGIQFHPESFATEGGKELIENFLF